MTDQTEPKPIIDHTLLANTSMDHSSDSEDSGGASPFKKAFRGTVWRKSMVNPTKKSTAQIINIMNEKIYKLQDVKKINVQYQRYRKVNFLFGISIIIPILLSIFTVDLEFDGNHPELLDDLLQACVWVTLVSIILNVMRYRQKLIYKKTTNNVPKETNIFTSGRIWNLLIEIIILMLVPNPWTNGIQIQSYDEDDDALYYFNFNDILAVFIMLRMFFVVRMVLQMSRYMSPTVVRLSYFFGTRNSGTYAIKCLLKRHPMRTLFVTYFSSIIIFAYMIRICERPLILIPGNENTMQISDYWNALWYVVVTMTTVGYGDFYAHTNFGRLVSFFCCTWGALVISIMVVVFTNVLDMDQSENKILVIMERLYLRKKLKTKAAIVIQSVARFIFARNKQKADDKHLQLLVIRIRNNVKKFQKINTRLKALNDRENTNEEMSREFEFMRYEMREIKQTIKNVTATFASDSKVSDQFTMRTESVQSDRNMSLAGFKLTPV